MPNVGLKICTVLGEGTSCAPSLPEATLSVGLLYGPTLRLGPCPFELGLKLQPLGPPCILREDGASATRSCASLIVLVSPSSCGCHSNWQRPAGYQRALFCGINGRQASTLEGGAGSSRVPRRCSRALATGGISSSVLPWDKVQ